MQNRTTAELHQLAEASFEIILASLIASAETAEVA